MREILFRGKSEYGKWVEGDLIQYESGEMAILNRFSEYGHEASEMYCRTKVKPETVSQFTGLYDGTKWEELTEEEREMFVRKEGNPSEWKGRKIFEGSVLKFSYTGNNRGVDGVANVVFENGKFGVKWGWHKEFVSLDGFANTDIEVIGNIHDNPELLEGGAEWNTKKL